MHEGVSNHGGGVTNRNPYGVLGIFQDQHVSMIAANKKLQVQIDRDFAAQDTR